MGYKGHILDWRMFCFGEVDPLWDGPHPLWNIQHRLTLLTLIVSFLFLLQVSYSDLIQKVDHKERLKGVHILLSNSQAGPGKAVKQEQEEISCNHVQAF